MKTVMISMAVGFVWYALIHYSVLDFMTILTRLRDTMGCFRRYCLLHLNRAGCGGPLECCLYYLIWSMCLHLPAKPPVLLSLEWVNHRHCTAQLNHCRSGLLLMANFLCLFHGQWFIFQARCHPLFPLHNQFYLQWTPMMYDSFTFEWKKRNSFYRATDSSAVFVLYCFHRHILPDQCSASRSSQQCLWLVEWQTWRSSPRIHSYPRLNQLHDNISAINKHKSGKSFLRNLINF